MSANPCIYLKIIYNLSYQFPLFAEIKIIDGDTIIINEKKIRLFGIDAPETNQYCFDKKKIEYSCGLNSTNALIQYIKKNRYKSFKIQSKRIKYQFEHIAGSIVKGFKPILT